MPLLLSVVLMLIYKFRSNAADLEHRIFHSCEIALPLQICFPIWLVFHQHLNSLIAYPGSPPEPKVYE